MKCSSCGAKIDMKKMTHEEGHCIGFLLKVLESCVHLDVYSTYGERVNLDGHYLKYFDSGVEVYRDALKSRLSELKRF